MGGAGVGVVAMGTPTGIPIVTVDAPLGDEYLVPALSATVLAKVSSAVSRYFLKYLYGANGT